MTDDIKIRKALRHQVTASINQAKSTIENPDFANFISTLKGIAAVLKSKLTLLDEVDTKLLCTFDHEFEKEVEAANVYQTNIQICLAEIDSVILSASVPVVSTTRSISSESNSKNVRLPKINIPDFSGDPLYYQSFMDSFENSVNSNTSLSDIEKFMYLRGLLKGKALDTVQGLSLSSSNYSQAIELLKSRFGDTKQLVASFYDSLLKLQPARDPKDTKKLRQLYDNIENCVRNLKTLGIDSANFGAMVVPIILSKVPDSIRLDITKETQSEQWDFTKVLSILQREVTAREQCQFVAAALPSNDFALRKQRINNNQISAASLHTQNNSIRNKPKACVYCQEAHKPWECDRITDLESRRESLRSSNRCFNCLSVGHGTKTCRSRFTCFHCKGKHNSSICGQKVMPTSGYQEQQSGHSSINDHSEVVILKTAITPVSSPNSSSQNATMARVMLDDGSQKTYISESLADKLNLPRIASRKVLIRGACKTVTLRTVDVVQISIHTTDPNIQMCITATVLKDICHPLSQQLVRKAIHDYPHLHSLKFSDYHQDQDDLSIDILIGQDYYYEFVSDITKRGSERGPVAIQTKLGWCLGGPIPHETCEVESSTNLSTIHTLQCSESRVSDVDQLLTRQVEQFWDLESIGIKSDENTVHDDFLSGLKYDSNDKRYEVRLPWKENHPKLPDNFEIAAARLSSNFRKLKATSKLHDYDNVIRDQLSNGIIERCTNDSDNAHYLPHRAVLRDDKSTTKLRIVYDASAKSAKHQPALNDCLYKGPSLNPLLFDILLRFRLHRSAFVCDIEKAFLQVSVNQIDRDALRFLWFEDPYVEDPRIIFFRFARVLFGLNCSPFMLNATLHHHIQKYTTIDPATIAAILRSLYVDDFTGGSDSTNGAFQLLILLTDILREGGFTVHKFLTNDAELQALIDEREHFFSTPPSESYSSSNRGEPSTTKVLGLPWDHENDTISVDFTDALSINCDTPTKRIILSALAKIYDPLGFVSPVTFHAKLIFQEACKRKLNWDDPLPEDIASKWLVWLSDLRKIVCYILPRCYIRDEVIDSSLFGFCDASPYGYAACVYLVFVCLSGNILSILVGSKTRIAPITGRHTIPRLELLSCYILSLFMETVSNGLEEEFKVARKLYWTDSMINLDRIRGTKNEYKQFVENRLKTIRSKSVIDNWFYVPTHLNPADIPSRGCLLSELEGDGMWRYGPEFLRDPGCEHSKFEQDIRRVPSTSTTFPRAEDDELRRKDTPRATTKVQTMLSNVVGLREIDLSSIIDMKRYSSLGKLLRVTAYVMRFAYGEKSENELSARELERAHDAWVCTEQLCEMKSPNTKFTKTAFSLGLYLDNGLLRCKGRLENSELSYDAKHPIYVPQSSDLARLLVIDAHDRVFHQRERSTLSELRSRYWIPQGRKIVRSVLRACLLCKRLEGVPLAIPQPPCLPAYRVEIAPPFTNMGLDHMGPVWVKNIFESSQQNSKLHKAYIAMFTCCTTRMIHLELQPNLEAAACVRAMKRTFSRVGLPKRVISDNHKTFKSSELKRFTNSRLIDWKYILELAPHWGGFYERLNGLVKRALRKILWRSRLSFEELETIIIEIEGTLNSRPLCYVYDDDNVQPLTPSHLGHGRCISDLPSRSPYTDECGGSKRYRYIRRLIEQFWDRFSMEYLTELRERERHTTATRDPGIRIGNVMLIKDKGTTRCNWPLGRVERLITSSDGVVRGAVLKTATGQLKRAVNQLFPLELELIEEPAKLIEMEPPVVDDEIQACDAADAHTTKRSSRIAARDGELVRRLHEAELEALD